MRHRLLIVCPLLLASAMAQAPAAVEATTVLEGRVVDMRGEGVPAARVRVVAWEDPTTTLARTVADGDGFYLLPKVPKRPALQVHGEAGGFCAGVESVGSARAVVVTVQHAVPVRGVLRNRRGEPVAGGFVRADPFGRTLTYAHCDARTDEKGRFELPAVPLAPLQFAAWVDGEGLARVLQHVGGPCEISLVPNEAKVTDLEVTIESLPADAPAVSLSLLPYRGGGLSYLPPPYDRPRFDAKGRWQLAGAPDCDYTLYPSSKAFAFAPREARVKAGAGPHRVVFRATPLGAASLSCRAVVKDADDKPVPGVPFTMRAPNGGAAVEASSDEHGRLVFASPLAAGADAVVFTTHEHWVVDQDKSKGTHVDPRSLTRHQFRVDPATELVLRVVPGCTVQGRLLLADGRPAAFVDVELQETLANRIPEWMAMGWATTGRDGTFRFVGRHHLADAVRLHVESRAGSFDGEPFHLLEPGAEHQAGECRLQPPATIEGVLLDAEQRPFPGVRVWLRDWDFARNSQASGRVVETLTDRDGRYRFLGVPAGGAWLQLLTQVEESFPRARAVEPFEVEAGKGYTFDLQAPAK